MKYDKGINWLITDFCNFNCEYCIYGNRTPELHPVDIEKTIKSLDSTGKIFKLTISGGEPFMVPNFIPLVKELTQKHFVVIVTNLSSQKIPEFFDVIDKDKVTICVSVHFHELEKKNLFDRFIKNYHYGVDRGFELLPRIVGYPGYMDNLDKYLNILKDNHISYFFTSFSGVYNGKKYPQSYTPEEIQAFNLSEKDLSFWESYHKPCPAGWNIMVSDSEGRLYPCYEFMFSPRNQSSNFFDSIVFPFDKPVLCPFETCGCPFYIYDKVLMGDKQYTPSDCRNVDFKMKTIRFTDYAHNKYRGAYRRIKKLGKWILNRN